MLPPEGYGSVSLGQALVLHDGHIGREEHATDVIAPVQRLGKLQDMVVALWCGTNDELRPGQEDTPITPWNWDSVIDRNKSAEKFIKRMTGMCTYLQGEEVLPRCSLLYEEFCVLNELDGLRLTIDGDREHRLDAAQREGIIHDLFHHKRSVSYKQIEDWITREEGFMHPHISGGQGVSGLESKMGSYIFFCKDVFGVDELDRKDYDMVEEIILWNTLFEDRKIVG